jgi:hypothetical protein
MRLRNFRYGILPGHALGLALRLRLMPCRNDQIDAIGFAINIRINPIQFRR